MSKADKQEKKAAKKAAKAEKKANKQPKNPEVVKTVISSVTALLCVVAIVFTSLSITNKICDTNLNIAKEAPANSGSQIDGDITPSDDSQTGGDVTPGDDSQTGGDVTPGDDSQTGSDVTPGNDSQTGGDSKTPSSSNSQPSGAPVGNDISKIVSYYNTAANATKAYKGTMKLKIVQGTTSKITDTSFPSFVKTIGNKMLPNDYPTNKSFTVTNGNGVGKNETKGENETKSINKILPIDNNTKMSTLSASGVQSASCTKVSGGYKVVIKLKSETVTRLSAKPKNHYSCMDILNITEKDLEPFTVNDCNLQYTGGTLTAIINDKNLLTEFDVNNPMHITGTLAYSKISGTAVIDASWKQNVKFTY